MADSLTGKLIELESKLRCAQRNYEKLERKLGLLNTQHKDMCKNFVKSKFERQSLANALITSLVVVDNWCTGQLLLWRSLATEFPEGERNFPSDPKTPQNISSVDALFRTYWEAKNADNESSTGPSEGDGGQKELPEEYMLRESLSKLQPHLLKDWLEHRVCVQATASHLARTEAARNEQALQEDLCRQRETQISHLKEELEKLDASRAMLQAENLDLRTKQDELQKVIEKDHKILHAQELQIQKGCVLEVEYVAEVANHRTTKKRLQAKEEDCKILKDQIKV
ncbi:unnamed protein product [Choristocarpus tenellus]